MVRFWSKIFSVKISYKESLQVYKKNDELRQQYTAWFNSYFGASTPSNISYLLITLINAVTATTK